MKNDKSKRVLISSEPRILADEIILANPDCHYTLVHDIQKIPDEYDFVFLVEKDFFRLASELSGLKHPYVCVIYTDPDCEFNTIKPHPRIDSYLFGILDEWVMHINSLLTSNETTKFDRKFLLNRKDRKDDLLVTKLLAKLWGEEKIIKNMLYF